MNQLVTELVRLTRDYQGVITALCDREQDNSDKMSSIYVKLKTAMFEQQKIFETLFAQVQESEKEVVVLREQLKKVSAQAELFAKECERNSLIINRYKKQAEGMARENAQLTNLLRRAHFFGL